MEAPQQVSSTGAVSWSDKAWGQFQLQPLVRYLTGSVRALVPVTEYGLGQD